MEQRNTTVDLAIAFAALAMAVWLGGSAALVTSAELDRRLHPLEYPLPYDVELVDPAQAPDALDPSADPRFPVGPTARQIAACAI